MDPDLTVPVDSVSTGAVRAAHAAALRTALTYALVAAAWILFSDLLLGLLGSAGRQQSLQTFKGIFFVTVTALLLYTLVRGNLARIHETASRAMQSEAKYRLLAEQTVDVIWRLEPDMTISYVNPAIQNLLGYTAAEFSGTSLADYVSPDEISRLMRFVKQRLGQHETDLGDVLVVGLRHKDGRAVPVEVRGTVLLDAEGQPAGFQGTARDITERLRSEEERGRAEEERGRLLDQVGQQARLVQQIINTVPEGVVLLDGEQRAVLSNSVGLHALEQLAGAGLGSVLGQLGDQSVSTLLTAPPRGLWHRVAVDGRVFDAISSPLRPILSDAFGTAPMAAVMDARAVSCDVTLPDARVLVLRDVTAELEVRARAEQQERMSAVGQLAAGIAHDFNNILAIIMLYSQTVLQSPSLSDSNRERLRVVVQQAKRATDLVQEILEFSRVTPLQQRPINLVPLMKELVKLLERTLPETIRIRLTYQASSCYVSADPGRIEQMVMNMVLNARDAMPEGGKLEIDLAPVEVGVDELPSLPEGRWIRMRVADTGPGIAPEILAHLFEPFFTTKAPGQGTGLGLAQVYGIVKQHNGEIVCWSDAAGTVFSLYFPALPAPEDEVCAFVPGTLRSGHGETLLLIEDNASTRAALTDALRILDYRVVAAANGQEALLLLARQGYTISLVISDLVMPEMGGRALLQSLRECGNEVPVLMLTGHPLEDELEQLMAEGLTAWMLKPPDLARLAELIAEILET